MKKDSNVIDDIYFGSAYLYLCDLCKFFEQNKFKIIYKPERKQKK